MKKFTDSNYVVGNDVNIAEAMRAITLNHRGTVVVVDSQNHVVGVVSDGDIRRAIVQGVIIEAPISKCININFVSLPEGISKKDSDDLLDKNRHINLVPVVDQNNKLVDLVVRID